MDDLYALVQTLSTEDKKEFKRFLLRKRMPKNRKDVELFSIYSKGNDFSKSELFDTLYPNETDKNPYHSLRKRLFKHLHDFLYLKQMDYSLQANLNKTLSLIRHYFNHQLNRLGWKEIRKIENHALREENYHILKSMYSIAINNFDASLSHLSLDELIQQHSIASKFVEDEENLKIIASVVRQELNVIIQSGRDANLQKLAGRLLRRFGLDERVYQHPRLHYNFILLMRDVTLAQKRYFEFEPFLTANLRLLEETEYLDSKPYYALNMYYMMAHTFYRNKNFVESLIYLNKMESELNEKNKGAYQQFYPKFILLKAACLNFTNNLDEAILLLKNLLEIKWLDTKSQLNATLNLSVYIFQKEEFKLANKILISLEHTDSWHEKIMGVEWRLKKSMVEVFFQYELENYDIAFDRIVSIERTFKDLLQKAKYKQVGVFLKLIRQIIQKPNLIGSEMYLKRIESSFEWKALDEEDIQAMGYYAWLKSKNTKEKYYQTQLAILNPQHSH